MKSITVPTRRLRSAQWSARWLRRPHRGWAKTLVPWLIVVAAGATAQAIGMPVAWLIGPMLAAVILSLRDWPPGPNPSIVFIGVQAVIGSTIVASFSLDSLKPLTSHWLPASISVILVLVFSIGGGLLLAKIAPIDAATASLGTIPGGASGMVAMAEDLGGDARLVAFMQYMRLVVVIVSISLLARFIETDQVPVTQALVEADGWPIAGRYALAFAVAVIGGWLGVRLNLPAGGLIGAMLVGLIPGALEIGPIAWPPFMLPLAYLLLGARVGSRFDRDVVSRIKTLLPYILGFVVGLNLLCAVLGWILAATTEIDLLTALLATSPGGIDAATIAALDTGANVGMVLSMQMVRLLLMVLAGPFIVRRLVPRAVV